jgi:hypothetical protein
MTRARGGEWKLRPAQRVIARYLVPPLCAAFPTPEPPRTVIGPLEFSRQIPTRSGR